MKFKLVFTNGDWMIVEDVHQTLLISKARSENNTYVYGLNGLNFQKPFRAHVDMNHVMYIIEVE